MNQASLAGFEPLRKIVCCPDAKTPLALMTLSDLRRCVTATEQTRICGRTIGALVSTVSFRAYPIIDQVVSFLDQDTLRLAGNADSPVKPEPSASESIKLGVKKWYDEFGWKQTDAGLYGDTSLFSQIDQSAHAFYEMSSHLSLLGRFKGGDYFLDAGSGAIPHPEYLAYSWFYNYRICVDLSLTALQEAASKVGSKGFYCMADLCRLPFRDNVFDGIVSGYAIQHVPESDQRQALAELYRVLAPKKYCCVVTDLSPGSMRSILQKVTRLIRPVKERPTAKANVNTRALQGPAPGNLYGHAESLAGGEKRYLN
jgi:SAM-dependent methyltransferase/uncharacterized protein YbaR (Trm112 family)